MKPAILVKNGVLNNLSIQTTMLDPQQKLDQGKAAGIENAGPHTLRKTAGAFYYMATRDIYATKEWMGHSDISITIKHYSGLMQSMKREDDLAFEKLLTAQLEGHL